MAKNGSDRTRPNKASSDQEWLKREESLLADIEKNIGWYDKYGTWNRWAYRTTSIVVLICAVIAPVTVISGMGQPKAGLELFGATPDRLHLAAVAITLILGLAEGLRRAYKFEHMWAGAHAMESRLIVLKNMYLDRRVGHKLSSPMWAKNYRETRKSFDDLMARDDKNFFDLVFDGAKAIQAMEVKESRLAKLKAK